MRSISTLSGAVGLLLAAAPQFAGAAGVTFRTNDIIPVVIEDTLTVRTARTGDRFRARLADTRDLPYGTRFEGRVTGVREARGERLASVDLEFNTIVLPGGQRQNIRAVPIPYDERSFDRGGDGRFVARVDKHKREKYVFGGMAGGLIVGSIFKKGTEGLILGALAGIAAAETDKAGDGDLVLKSGSKIGVMFEKGVTLNWDQRYDRDSRDLRDNRDNRDFRTNRDGRTDRDDRFGRDSDRDPRDRDGRDRDVLARDQDRRDRDDRFNDERANRDDREVAFRCGNRDIRFSRELRPYRDRDTWMVPLDRVSEQMRCKTDRVGRSIYVESDDAVLKIEVDSRDYRLNGRRMSADHVVTDRNGVIFVPISMLSGMTRDVITIDGQRINVDR